MTIRTQLVAAALVVTVAAADRAAAQSRAAAADLTGAVLDQTGGLLADASIAATNVETSAVRTAISTGDGRFTIPALPPGTYTVRASKAGFNDRVIEGIVLALGAVVDMQITLVVSGITSNVAVVSVANVPEATVSQLINRQQIEGLPINGRNFIAFSLLGPGITNDRTPQQGVSLNSGVSFVGQHARSNNITVDGLDNNEMTIGAVRENFGQETVREFQVLTAGYPAEFGKASGGVVNIVTRSGTNALAGGLFGYFRDESLNAREYFEKFDVSGARLAQPKAPYSQQQYGGTLGGPLKRDRTFFFAAVERLDIVANNFVTIDDVTVVNHPFTSVPLGTPAQILRNAGFPIETGHVPYTVRSTQGFFKLNHQFSPQQHLAVRASRTHGLNENIEPFGGLVARSRAGASDSRQTAIGGWLTSALSSVALNEARFQWSAQDFSLYALDPRCGGPCVDNDDGGPTLEVAGIASVGRHRLAPTARDMVRTQFVDTFSYYRGAHHVKVGIDFNWVHVTNYSLPLGFGGRYIFNALPSIPGLLPGPVTSIQAVALGYPAAYVQGYGNPRISFKYRDISAFGHYEWRPVHRLTASMGVRYQTQFWPHRQYQIPGYPGSYDVPQDRNDVAPRIAATWQPLSASSTYVHGSYGMFFENNLGVLYTVPSIVDGRDGVRTLAVRFPGSTTAWNAPNRRLLEPTTAYPSVRIAIDPSRRTPYAHHTTTGITRAAGGGVLTANFTYVRGFNLVGVVDLNPIVPSLGPGRRPEDAGVAGTSASILQYSSFGETWYRGLTLSWSRRLDAVFHVLASYTLSKAEDTATDFQTSFIVQNSGRGRDPADPNGLPIGFDPRAEKGRATHDQRHRLVVSGAYSLPAAFQASAILTVGSGRPFNILAGADLNGDGDGGSFPSDRARRNPADPSTSVPRNSGTTPGHAVLDLRFSRKFRLVGGSSIEALLELFNVFNRVNYTDVNGVFGTGSYPTEPLPSFGRFLQTGPPRQVQIAARWSF